MRGLCYGLIKRKSKAVATGTQRHGEKQNHPGGTSAVIPAQAGIQQKHTLRVADKTMLSAAPEYFDKRAGFQLALE
jgi:hypothetical protein